MDRNTHRANNILILFVAAFFVLGAVTLSLLGVNIYKTAASDARGQALDDASLYFAEKVRQCEDKSKIQIKDIDAGAPALVMGSVSEGKDMETWFYVYECSLKEITVAKDSKVSAQDGQDIMEMKSADFEIVGGDLLQVTMTEKGNASSTMNLHLAGGGTND